MTQNIFIIVANTLYRKTVQKRQNSHHRSNSTIGDQHLRREAFSWRSEFVHCGSVAGKRSRKRINEVVAVTRLCCSCDKN